MPVPLVQHVPTGLPPRQLHPILLRLRHMQQPTIPTPVALLLLLAQATLRSPPHLPRPPPAPLVTLLLLLPEEAVLPRLRGGDKLKGRSIIHNELREDRVVFLSFDLEHGGEECGILQISGEFLKISLSGDRPRYDTASAIQRNPDCFDSYVNPGDEAIWDPEAIGVHKLTPTDSRITNADDIGTVWERFNIWIDRHTSPEDTIVLVAWNGATCDLKWLWKVTQAPLSALHLSSKIKYFIDPYRVIKKYKEGGLHPSNSKIESLELGVVWTFISKRNFNKKHNSLEDVRAQTDVITHDQFVRYIDTGFAVQDVLDIFTATQRRSFLKGMESIRPVHEPWIEVTPEHDVTWEPDSADSYTGRSGGGFPGPTAYIQQIARNAVSLACMFFAVLPWSFFVLVAQRTQKYAYEDWVVEKYGEDRDGNPRKKYHLEKCAEGVCVVLD